MRAAMTTDRAETLALGALAFLAARPDLLERFLEIGGLDPGTLRQRALDRDVLRAVLDFLLTDDAMVVDFCGEQELDARDIHLAHRLLGGI